MGRRTREFYWFQNKVMEKLALTHLSPNESKYCWVVFRKTFGFGKYQDLIKRDLMARLTGIAETTASGVKKRLIKRNIIYANTSIQGFNLNTDLWEKVKLSLPFEKVKVSLQKGQGRAEKKGQGIITLQRTTKKLTKEGGGGLKKLSYKETEKLEKKTWLKQVMWQRSNFKERFIEEFLSKAEFMPCYDAYIAYQGAQNVRDKEAWILAKKRSGPEPEA